MEGSYEYFKDILEKMLMLDYDIFRISLIMYRNFDFTDFKESYVKLTKKLYKQHNKQLQELQNRPEDQLALKKKYNTFQLWDEISINSSPVWIMEFASFLQLDEQQYNSLLQNFTSFSKPVQNYQLFRMQDRLNFTDDQVKRFVLYRTFMMNDPNQNLYKLYVEKKAEIEEIDQLNFRYGMDGSSPAPENP